jgi:hypothetical protein
MNKLVFMTLSLAIPSVILLMAFTGCHMAEPQSAPAGFNEPLPADFRVLLLPGQTSVVFSMYGTPGGIDNLKQLVQTMREQSLGNGFDPAPTPLPEQKPVFDYLATVGWPAACWPGADLQIAGGRSVFGASHAAVLEPMERAGVFHAIQ